MSAIVCESATMMVAPVVLVMVVCRVSEHESRNKMGLKNLATVFGPTLLRPASRNSQPKTMEQLFCLAAHETAVQVTVIYQLLLMKSKGVQFEVNANPLCITTCWNSIVMILGYFLCTVSVDTAGWSMLSQ